MGLFSYFQSFLEEGARGSLPSLEELVQEVIQQEDDEVLSRAPSSEEVFDAFLSIPIDSSLGLDAFSSGFYRAFWHIVGGDVMEAVAEVF